MAKINAKVYDVTIHTEYRHSRTSGAGHEFTEHKVLAANLDIAVTISKAEAADKVQTRFNNKVFITEQVTNSATLLTNVYTFDPTLFKLETA